MSVSVEQSLQALQTANSLRSDRAQLRRAMRTGEVTLAEVMLDPPEAAKSALVIDVIRWQHGKCVASLRVIGKQALRDRINLMLTVGSSSTMTRAWVAEHGTYNKMRPQRRDLS